jgi:hypothetical protein
MARWWTRCQSLPVCKSVTVCWSVKWKDADAWDEGPCRDSIGRRMREEGERSSLAAFAEGKTSSGSGQSSDRAVQEEQCLCESDAVPL